MLLEETIKNYTNDLFRNNDIVHGWKKTEIEDLQSLGMKESYFTFDTIL